MVLITFQSNSVRMSVTAPQYKTVIHIALVTQYVEGENKLLIMEMNYLRRRVKSSRMFSIRNYERSGMDEEERITETVKGKGLKWFEHLI